MSEDAQCQINNKVLDKELINPFIESTVNVLKTMAMIVPTPQSPRIKTTQDPYGDITAIIGMAGDNIKGSFAVSFTEPCIFKILSNMLGEEIKALSRDVSDGVGEITNIITGGVKAQLADKGYSVGMAIPTVVSGKGHSVEHVTEHPVTLVPFETEAGPFFIEVSLIT